MPSPRLPLFVASAVILFLELACIRWFPAHVLYLTFFTNTVLLAGFVGMSVGCLTARSPRRHLLRTPALLAVALGVGLLLNVFRGRLEYFVDVGNQKKPEVVFFGTEANVDKRPEFLVPVEVVAGGMFLLIAAVFVGPGQELGRAFAREPNRVAAYSVNIAGSLIGIGLFAGCSWLHLPPPVWFAVAAAGLAYLLLGDGGGRLRWPLALLGLTVALTVPTSGLVPTASWTGKDVRLAWSPYYRIDYQPADGAITTNLIGHQVMTGRDVDPSPAYHLPHLFNAAVGRPPAKRILVIGAGSGNDVSRALVWAAPDAVIDAVDIEPVIQGIGKADHPDKPYSDPRVKPSLNDGRNFLRRAPDGEYDLVVYALVDSLVLHSGYGNIRLESYLFTREAFADVKRVLKPTGAFAVYNFFRQGWVVARLRDALRDTFGADPVALVESAEPVPRMELDEYRHVTTFFYAGAEGVVGPVRAKFAGGPLWVPADRVIRPETPIKFGDDPPTAAGKWVPLGPTVVADSAGTLPPATDVWPFFYTRHPTLPGYLLRGVGLMVLLSAVLWLLYRPKGGLADGAPAEPGMLARMFLLGAGFMLMETKAVVHMALLFGSTWAVNTVVFFAILVVALLANLFVLAVKPKRLEWAYAGLFVALAANMLVPLDAFLGLDRWVQAAAACALVFAPIAFAGVVFAVSFGRTQAPDRAFGANVAGALAGGVAENLSMVLGFQWLLAVAVGFYALSALGGRRPTDMTSDPLGPRRPER
jgi:hypothetical protein